MKTFLLGLLFLGFTNLTFSQNNMAYVDVSSEIDFIKIRKAAPVAINSSYINSFAAVDISKRILSFQNVAAYYNIKSNEVYTEDKPTTYDVVFQEANNRIENVYDQSGEILSSKQSYKAIKLPYSLSSKVAEQHPGWSIKQVACSIAYLQGEPLDIHYKVKLKKGYRTKTLKIE
ncbi:hypothetical protein [Mariniflexile sp. AS56]|uniref:hypothetical protein n=1 Tax=Mariniflexile sp. AS56 TaxID=3063957 RepID=UPI0026EE92EA|nr:hypothetical protein [Mariniflexile sp. AS56]MDO7173548.1 hypothetical protein [Mariniflexile sp. AS56]